MPRSPVTVKDVSAEAFIATYASHLKKSGKVEIPAWTDIAKTAYYKELSPQNPDWFYVRCASLARKVYLSGGRGVGAFRKVYGGAANRGSRPSRRATASGSVIRSCFQQLEKLKVLEKSGKGGRFITSTGQRDLDRIAGRAQKRTSA
eukprot:TRINITY_DN23_c0_g1_i1.p1 TRINITY_DN23_c0_g1~~TRINITY_DN23_c0_g1_i1.p1  ORF type:complete len:159 (+),score=32.33 TRINITY_DN23_c0_g1_i1:38-478(+)